MLSTAIRKALTLACYTSAFAFLGAILPAAHAQTAPAVDNLVGTWRVTVHRFDCKTGATVGPPFSSLATYNVGGTVTDTTTNPGFFPSERSPGHGFWKRTGPDDYTSKTIGFITLNGVLTRSQVITQRIDLESATPNRFIVPLAIVQFYSPTGTLLITGCAKAVGVRFQ